MTKLPKDESIEGKPGQSARRLGMIAAVMSGDKRAQ